MSKTELQIVSFVKNFAGNNIMFKNSSNKYLSKVLMHAIINEWQQSIFFLLNV